jgi:hypothetical protein
MEYLRTSDLALPVKNYAPHQRDLLLFGVESRRFRHHFPTIEPPSTVRGGHFEGGATPSTSARTQARQATATSWKTFWSPRPAPIAKARACVPIAGA